MRKEYGKALREAFERGMREKLPQFLPYKPGSSLYVVPGERVFRWIPEEPIHCFAIVAPGRTGGDDFTIEIGWSSEGRFPELGMRPSGAPSAGRSEFDRTEFVCRLSALWSKEDYWWPLADLDPMDPDSQMRYILASAKPLSPQEARDAVAPRVEDALDKLVRFGVPYLEEYLHSRKGGWDPR
jgi:hypothetical protein